MRVLWLLGFAMLGCQPGGEGGSEYNLTQRDIWSLQVILDADTTTAGIPLGLEVSLLSEDGDITNIEQWTLASDAEDLVQYTRETVTPTLAGPHVFTVNGTSGEREYTAQASVLVGSGAPYIIDLNVSDHGMLAGEAISWDIEAADQWGNPIDTTGLTPTTDSTDVTITAAEITTTVPGTYAATAELGTVTDTEVFVVGPNLPIAIDLTLNNPNPELYETVHATVVVTDAHGNVTDDPWSLWVEGAGTTDINYSNITFWNEGTYTVFAGVDGTSLQDSVGPFLIDTTGPNIEIDEPPRGDWVDGDDSTVSGRVTDDWSDVALVTLNGESVSLDSSGRFSENMDWDFGINVLESYAEDSDGNSSTDTRALIAGDFKGYGQEVENGLTIRIKQGTGGFDTLEELGENLVTATDLDALIPSPVYSSSYKKWGVTWYSVNLYVRNPKLGAIDFELDPRSTGVLRTTVTVNDPELDWSASGKVTFIGYSGSGDITADAIEVEVDLKPRISGRTLQLDVDRVDTTVSGFEFDMDGWLYDVLKFFGVNNLINSAIESYMEGAIEDVVKDEVPGMLEDALSSLELSADLPIQGTTYTLDAAPSKVSVDAYGLNLNLASKFKPKVWKNSRTGLGSLFYGYRDPTYSVSSGMNLGLNADFLNQVMYALWGGGLLQQTLTGSELGLDPADLSLFFPGLTELTIELDGLLPPAVVTGSGSDMFELQLGEVHLVLYNGNAATGDVLVDVYFSAFMGMNLTATSEALSATMGEPEVYFDVIYPEANTAGAHDTEALLVELVPYLLPMLTDALGEIPLPAIEGFSIKNIKVGTDGPEDGFLLARGQLKAE